MDTWTAFTSWLTALKLYIFFQLTVTVTGEATQSKLPSFHWTPRGTGALVPAAAPCAHLPPGGVQMNLGKSLLVLESAVLIEFLSFI